MRTAGDAEALPAADRIIEIATMMVEQMPIYWHGSARVKAITRGACPHRSLVTGEPFGIAGTATSHRALSRLPEKVGTAVVELCDGPLADNPARLGKPLRFELDGLHCARRGDYRVIYRIDLGRHRVEIVAIEHRSTAHRSR